MEAVAARHPVRARAVLFDGAEAGFLSALAVLIVHFGCDLVTAEPFRTPAILNALLQGTQTPGVATHFSASDAARYSFALLTSWLVVGLAVSWLISISDAHPKVWYLSVAAMTFFFSSVIYLAWALEVPGLPRLNLSLGALAGSAATVSFLALRHPGFCKQFDRVQLTEVGAHDLADAYEREWYTRSQYRSVIEQFGDIPAFSTAVRAKDHHIARLLALFDAFDLDAPRDLPDLQTPQPASLEEAYHQGIDRERAMAKMYDRFLLAVEEHKLWEAFESLRWSCEAQILSAFQRNLAGEDAGESRQATRSPTRPV